MARQVNTRRYPPELKENWQKARRQQANAAASQHKAANPALSAWVSAHAGSGKTYLLVNRVVRLLLENVDPARILCLTYTRAAAAEMRARIFQRLAEWIDKDDADLLRIIHEELDHRSFRHDDLPRARRLFARALETPGGLKVQTIHAFCERLLQAFPVEAGLPPGFEVMDGHQAATLLAEAQARVLQRLAPSPASRDAFSPVSSAPETERLRAHLALLSSLAGEARLPNLLRHFFRHQDLMRRYHMDRQFRAWLLDGIRGLVGLHDGPANEEEWPRRWHAGLDREGLAQAISRLRDAVHARATNQDRAALAALQAMLQETDPIRAFETARDLLLKKDGGLRNERRWIIGKAMRERLPDVAEWLQRQAMLLHDVVQNMRAARLFAVNEALYELGHAIFAEYETAKRRAALFDFDDLIDRTLALLSHENVNAAWVLYRLDGGIDHLLLDEAQDTSPRQWRILKLLTEEFHAGEGAAEGRRRTIFVVGDIKQSIYSFQGAEPEAFRLMRDFFQQRLKEARLPFASVDMDISFRTAPQILEVVDKVLRLPGFSLGEEEIRRHKSTRPHAPGFVELWPLEEQPAKERDDDDDPLSAWTPPSELASDMKPRLRLAARIAERVRAMLDGPEFLAPLKTHTTTPRPIRPDDIMILVRNRTTLMDAIVSALKRRGVPVAGVDRLKITEHIAVRDMLALARFLVLPEDDLSLAAALKSPLFTRDDGQPFDDDDLLRLRCHLFDFSAPLENASQVHDEKPLWHQLRQAARQGAPVRGAVEQIERWSREAGLLPPFELFAAILWRDGGLARFTARLGQEAAEPLEALLEQAMRHERGALPSLIGLIEHLEIEAPEISRDLDKAQGAVRVMTVHGAKGLEAPVVFIADANDVPHGQHATTLDITIEQQGEPPFKLPLWLMGRNDRNAAAASLVRAARDDQKAEYHRLLYVAMTRAADRLYVCGVARRRESKTPDTSSNSSDAMKSWHEWLSEVLARDDLAVDLGDGRTGWRSPAHDHFTWSAPSCDHPPPTEPPPPWAERAAPREPSPRRWLSPSRLAPADESGGAATTQDHATAIGAPAALSPLRREHGMPGGRFHRGILVHQLLQFLPDIPPEHRAERALAWLRAPAQGLDHEQALKLWNEVRAILEASRLAPLFGPNSRAEAPFAARVRDASGASLIISGQIDRLVITDDTIIMADYKTARPIPESLAQVPGAYVRQLALYGLALLTLHPRHALRAVLLWTAGPKLMQVPREMLDGALSDLRLPPLPS